MQREILTGVGVFDRQAASLLVQQKDIAVRALWRALHSHTSFAQPCKYFIQKSKEVCHNGKCRKQRGAAAKVAFTELLRRAEQRTYWAHIRSHNFSAGHIHSRDVHNKPMEEVAVGHHSNITLGTSADFEQYFELPCPIRISRHACSMLRVKEITCSAPILWVVWGGGIRIHHDKSVSVFAGNCNDWLLLSYCIDA